MTKIDYGNLDNLPWQFVREGITRKVFGMGAENINATINKVENGNEKNPHTHEENEQIALILEGECDYYVNGIPYRMTKGSWITVPAGVEHYIHVYDSPVPVLNMDIFYPLREEYNESYGKFIENYRK